MTVTVGNHQSSVAIPNEWLVALEHAGRRASEMAASWATHYGAPLLALTEIDVALVDDETSSRVHQDFMEIEGPADVITFQHGEIVIGVEVAKRQAKEYGVTFPCELLRYLAHGILHLAGYEDEQAEDRLNMDTMQEKLVLELRKEFAEIAPYFL